MATYHYKAITKAGAPRSGRMEATNETDLELRLSRMGLDLINFKTRSNSTVLFRRKQTSRVDLITFSFHLEQLIRSGVPLTEALKDLRDSNTHPSLQAIVSQLIEDIESGKTFSQALEKFPSVFDSIYCSMVKVGEHSGKLEDVLQDLAEMTRWQDELAARLKRVLIYPLFVFGVLSIVLLFVMTYLVPQLLSFLEATQYELPWHTATLLFVSSLFSEFWLLLILIPIALLLTAKFLPQHSTRFRYWLDKKMLNAWLIGPILLRIKLARFANYMAMLFSSGISVLESIDLGRQLVDNAVLEASLKTVRQQISDGETISNSFSNVGFFPNLVVRMLRVGEVSGALDKALLQISYFYNRESNESIARLEQFLAPTLIILIAAVMSWVILSVIGPMYDALIGVVGS